MCNYADIYDDLISRRVHCSDAEKFAEVCPCPCNGVGWGFIWWAIEDLITQRVEVVKFCLMIIYSLSWTGDARCSYDSICCFTNCGELYLQGINIVFFPLWSHVPWSCDFVLRYILLPLFCDLLISIGMSSKKNRGDFTTLFMIYMGQHSKSPWEVSLGTLQHKLV